MRNFLIHLLSLIIFVSCNNNNNPKNEMVFDAVFKQKTISIVRIEEVSIGVMYIKFYTNGKFEELNYEPIGQKTIGDWEIQNNTIKINGLKSIKSIKIIKIKNDRIDLYLIKNNNKVIDVVGIFLKDKEGNPIEEFTKIEYDNGINLFD